jgi:hypothetical protein
MSRERETLFTVCVVLSCKHMATFPHPSLPTLHRFLAFIENLKISIQSFGVLPWGRRWVAGFTPRKYRFQAQARLFGCYGRQSSTGTGSSLTLSVFLSRNHSIDTPHPYFIHLLLVQYCIYKMIKHILNSFNHLPS